MPEYLSVRTVEMENIKIGGDTSFSFMSENNNIFHPYFALEIPAVVTENYPESLKKFYGSDEVMNCAFGAEYLCKNLVQRFKKAQEQLCDLVCIKFNLKEDDNLEPYKEALKEILQTAQKPLIVRGSSDKNFDGVLLKELASAAQKPCIIAFAQDLNFEEILPSVIKNNHVVVLRTPIDINLTKELNILAVDAGISPDKILVDPDMGGLGYGLDYGYSIIERIKVAGFEGDKMLNMPIIVFAGEEAFKAKEAKSDDFDNSWGELEKRALMWEISTASAVMSAGANVIVLWHPETIKILKGIL